MAGGDAAGQRDCPAHRREKSDKKNQLELRDNEISVQAAVETQKFIEPQEIKEWEAAIHARVGRLVRLELEQLQLARKDSGEGTRATPNRDYLGGGAIRPAGGAAQHASIAGELESVQSRIGKASGGDLLRPLDARTVGVSIRSGASRYRDRDRDRCPGFRSRSGTRSGDWSRQRSRES